MKGDLNDVVMTWIERIFTVVIIVLFIGGLASFISFLTWLILK